MDKEELMDKLTKAICDGDEETASQATQEALSSGIEPLEAIHQASKGLQLLGERYERFEVFLPELILGADAMKVCVDILLPHMRMEQKAKASLGSVVIGTVCGDIHDVGKNLVASMLSIGGFHVYDLGCDVPVKRFVEKAEEVKAKIIALSALMTTSANYQREVIKYLKDAGLRDKYYIVVGGAPITPDWTSQIGADGHARLAVHVGELIERLVGEDTPPPLSPPIIIGY